MLHVSTDQLRMFEENLGIRKPRQPSGKPRQKRRKEELPENILEEQIRSLLAVRGWIVTRNQVGLYLPYRVAMQKPEEIARAHPVRIGETGTADWRAERAIPGEQHVAQLFYYECKAPGRKPKPDQLRWLERRRAAGIPAEWFDAFDGDFGDGHEFLPWYRRTWGE